MVRYRLGEDMFLDTSDGITVVINCETGRYWGMDALASAACAALADGFDIESVAGAVSVACADVPANIEERVEAFAKKLVEAGILAEDPEREVSGNVILIADDAASDGYDFAFEAYDDISDLILADPIHDVDVARGWPVLAEDE